LTDVKGGGPPSALAGAGKVGAYETGMAAGRAKANRGVSRRSPIPLLANGFRPFFLGAALWMPVALGLWLAALSGGAHLPALGNAVSWHRHEMLFGGVGAIVTGFLLTAVPNWTGRLPVRGAPLAGLFVLWAAPRLLQFLGNPGPLLAAAVETLFFAALLVFVWREIVAGRNWRNLPVAALISLLALGAPLSRLESLLDLPLDGFGPRLGLAAVLMLIALIGGRIVPSFTRNWLVRQGSGAVPAPFGRFDTLVLAIWGFTLLAWLSLPARVSGPMFLASGFLHLLRMLRWQGQRTFDEPLVTVLHLAYAWLGIGALLYGLALEGLGLDPPTALHGFTAGAIGTMTLAVMTRASLGHTGRPLTADAWTVVIYLLVTLGTLARLAAAAAPEALLALAALCWGGAYALFFLRYLPILARPRIDSGGPE